MSQTNPRPRAVRQDVGELFVECHKFLVSKGDGLNGGVFRNRIRTLSQFDL
jgi:hypothetical protein